MNIIIISIKCKVPIYHNMDFRTYNLYGMNKAGSVMLPKPEKMP